MLDVEFMTKWSEVVAGFFLILCFLSTYNCIYVYIPDTQTKPNQTVLYKDELAMWQERPSCRVIFISFMSFGINLKSPYSLRMVYTG